jgi:hypothetical protein
MTAVSIVEGRVRVRTTAYSPYVATRTGTDGAVFGEEHSSPHDGFVLSLEIDTGESIHSAAKAMFGVLSASVPVESCATSLVALHRWVFK